MKTPTLRGYVWVFCMYLACTVEQIAHTGHAISPPHVDLPLFFTLVPSVIGPAFCVFIFLSMLPSFKNRITRTVLILSAFGFACDIVFALHQFEYIAFRIPHWLSGWSFFIATCLLGYRTDQLLKQGNREIEAN